MSVPYVPETTKNRFYVPKTLASDFDTFLNQDIPNMVMNFEHLTSWYNKNQEGYVPQYIRGEIYPNATKSRYENTDNNMNVRFSVSSGAKKGDMIIDANSVIYLLDWEVALESNNAPSRALRCNIWLEIYRRRAETVDDRGYVIAPEGEDKICNTIPANAYRYDGRPEYSSIANTPGITPNALTLMSVQYNDSTKNIRIDDYFYWYDTKYTIIDIDLVGVGLDFKGVIKIQAKKASGGYE